MVKIKTAGNIEEIVKIVIALIITNFQILDMYDRRRYLNGLDEV